MHLLLHAFPSYLSFALLLSSNILGLNAQELHASTTAANLKACLAGLNVSYPGDSTFPSESLPYNSRLPYTPIAIALPTSADGVSKVVKCGARLNLPVVGRSGGHSYAAYGLGGRNGSLVCDMSGMKNITIKGNNAVVQTGNRLGEVATYLWNNGQHALPHGTCPMVGVGGHTGYGGFGPISRLGGLLLDRVVSAQVVLADGSIVTATNSSHSDLFWALKGAGPSYGIVTAWTYSMIKPPPVTTVFQVSLGPYLTGEAFASAFSQFQAFAKAAPKELGAQMICGKYGPAVLQAAFMGNYFGSKADFMNLAGGFIQALNGTIVQADEYTVWTDVLVQNAQGAALIEPTPETPLNFFTKSLVTTEPLSNSSVLSFGNYLVQTAENTDVDLLWYAQAYMYGGAIATDFAPDSASYAHRDAFMVFQFFSATGNGTYPAYGFDLVGNMLNSITTNPTAAYPNYIDPTLTTQQWQSQYFGDNIHRLSRIKALYDPHNVFYFPQSIPLSV